MQVIRHQQHDTTMPNQVLMMMGRCRQDGISYPRLTKLIPAANLTIEGDEEEAAVFHPSRHLMRKTFALGQIHMAKR